MSDLHKLTVRKADFDLRTAFFWVEFENGKTLQGCLTVVDKPYNFEGEVLTEVDADDFGHDWGICRDINIWAVRELEEVDWDDIKAFLLEKAEAMGLEVV